MFNLKACLSLCLLNQVSNMPSCRESFANLLHLMKKYVCACKMIYFKVLTERNYRHLN